MKKTILLFIFTLSFQSIFSQKIEIPTKKTGLKVVALIDLKEQGQLLITQRNNKESFFATLITNEMEMKWEAECPFEDDNGPRAGNIFSFLQTGENIFIVNQSKHNYYSVLNIETGELTPEIKIKKTSELRKGEFFVSKEKLYMANTFDNQLKIYEIRNESLIPKCEIYPPALTTAVKNASMQIINVSNDTILSYQSLPEPNHRKLHLIFYKHKINGSFIDSIHNTLELKKHSFAFNSIGDLNCQYVFEYNGNIYMFGNLAPRLSENFGQFPSSNDSRGIWWASFDKTMHSENFYLYPFKSIFKKADEIVIGHEKYWGVKADGDSGFFVNMNQIPGGIYVGNLTFYINPKGEMKWFTNTDNKDNFMRYNGIFTRQYIKKSDMIVLNDEWNFYSSHHFNKIIYNNIFQSDYVRQIAEKADKYKEDNQKSELALTLIQKNGFAVLAQYYYKKNKVITLEVIK
ncbi:MAG: hypothetical protein HUU47_02435 [Bacteroidetes bacterium]|nr:hypothetical protein [Bacteroidota bacterium]